MKEKEFVRKIIQMANKSSLIKLFRMVIILLIIIELVGRYYGLHDYPVYVESENFEYMHAPNQKRMIYGNLLVTNKYGMRSKPIKKSDSCNVLLIGDSVINGGNLTDHKDLASTILEDSLSNNLRKIVRVLNISAGSWGPDNAAAFLNEFGVFRAKAIVLVVSSHDAFDVMRHEKIVGEHVQFPEKNSVLAILKLIQRINSYAEKVFSVEKKKEEKLNNFELGISKSKEFNKGFEYFKTLCRTKSIPLLVVIHPTKTEIEMNRLGPGGLQIQDFCVENDINFICELDRDFDVEFLRDEIHYSVSGQKNLASILYPYIKDIIKFF